MEFQIKSPKGLPFNIKAEKTDFTWNNDSTTMYQIGRCESDLDEYVLDWLPESLIKALDRPTMQAAAIKAIGDYIAGWYGYDA